MTKEFKASAHKAVVLEGSDAATLQAAINTWLRNAGEKRIVALVNTGVNQLTIFYTG